MQGTDEKKVTNPNNVFALLGALGLCTFVVLMMLWSYVTPHQAPASSPHGSEVGHHVSSGSPSGRASVSRNEQTVVPPSATKSSDPSHGTTSVTEPQPTPTPSAAPTPEQQVYVVQKGDTLSSISAATGVSVDRLAEVNGIRNVHLIYRGSALVIPQP